MPGEPDVEQHDEGCRVRRGVEQPQQLRREECQRDPRDGREAEIDEEGELEGFALTWPTFFALEDGMEIFVEESVLELGPPQIEPGIEGHLYFLLATAA